MKNTVQVTEKSITLLIPLDRPFTTMDRINRTGLSDFMKVLRENGWADSNDAALKEMTIQNEGFDEGGVSYIRWTALLS